MVEERIQKLLARAGYGSRRACEEYITAGRVTVDGVTVTQLGVKADPDNQDICIDGGKLTLQSFVYYMLNKPKGVVCVNHDPMFRTLAVNLIPDSRRLFTVGRLDEDSEGLLLVTNDGDWANRLTHPRYKMEKTYQVRVQGKASPASLDKLRSGVYLSEGKTEPAKVRIKRSGRDVSVLTITIHQGLNRQVRRMLARVGLKTITLRRVAIGPLKLGRLKLGEYRKLTRDEVKKLGKSPRDPKPAPGHGESASAAPATVRARPKRSHGEAKRKPPRAGQPIKKKRPSRSGSRRRSRSKK